MKKIISFALNTCQVVVNSIKMDVELMLHQRQLLWKMIVFPTFYFNDQTLVSANLRQNRVDLIQIGKDFDK